MSYPTTIDSYVTKINKNASGWYVPVDSVVIPTASPYETYLDHVPRDVATTTIADFTYTAAAPGVGQYNLDLIYGKVTFSAGNPAATKNATYYSLGDDIMAEHMNELQEDMISIETELGTDPAGASGTVRERLEGIEASGINGQRIIDNTIRAGALMNDIKGVSWEFTKDVLTDISAHVVDGIDAHQATAIGAIDPGATLIATVQDHIDTIGNGSATTTNPHGQVLSDFNAGTGTVAGTARFQSIYATTIVANSVNASGNVMPVASGYAGGPSIQEHSCVGTIAYPFASGNFDILQAAHYKTGIRSGVTGTFSCAGTSVITVENGLIVSIV